MPYLRTPPGSWNASYTTTSQPAFARSAAHDMPAGPDPTIPTRNPAGSMYGKFTQPSRIAMSPTYLSRRPIATGASVSPTVHTPSHWFS